MFTTSAYSTYHIPSAFIVDKFICHDCGALDDYVEDLTRGELICKSCGAVNSERMCMDTPSLTQRDIVFKTYKKIHHFSERMSQFCCTEPPIPEDLRDVITSTHVALLLTDDSYTEKFNEQPYNQHLIRKVLRSVKVTPEIEEKHKSQKFKFRPFTHKRFFEKFNEKWKSIAAFLSDTEPKIPSLDLICTLKRLFNLLQKPFQILRHNDKCDGKTAKCHKVFACRYKFYNYDYVIRELLFYCQHTLKMKGVYDTFKHEFSSLSKRKKQQMDIEFQNLMDYLGWDWPKEKHKRYKEKPNVKPQSKK